MRLFCLWAAFLLTACQTTEGQLANKQAALNQGYAGRPMSDYMLRNGVSPENFFDMPGGERVFTFGLPCKSNWHTMPIDKGGSPASFVVTRVDVHNYCP